MCKERSHILYTLQEAQEIKKQALPNIPKEYYNYKGKGHLANECFIFCREDGDRFIPILCDTNAVGEKRGANYKGSKQL